MEDIWKGVILASLCFMAYYNSLYWDLVHDDIFAIKDNQDVRPATPIGNLLVNDFWGKPMSDPTSHKSYRPITVLSFRLNYMVHGLNPFGYHLVNIALHTLCVFLIWALSARMVFVGIKSKTNLSFETAMIFAVHPVHTEAVSGVVGRADILACLLLVLSLYLYYLCCIPPVTTTPSSLFKWAIKFSLSMFLGVCSMLCKENGATVFGVIFVYDFFLNFYQKRNKSITSYSVFWRLLVVTCVACISLVCRVSLLNNQLPLFSAQDNPASFSKLFLTRVLTYNYLFYFNAKLLIMPTTLCYDWQMNSIPLIEDIIDYRNIGTIIFYIYLGGLLLKAIISLNKDFNGEHVAFMSLILVIIPFLPASNLLIRVGFVVAERLLYISSIGYCILLVYGMWTMEQTLRKYGCKLPFTRSMVAFIVVFFSWKTVIQNRTWANRESLFISGMYTVPGNAKVHYNYANLLKDMGRTDEAILYYRNTLSLCHDHASAHNNLGTLLAGSEAAYHFKQAIQHNPQHYKAFFNLGNNHWDHGREKEAKLSLRECLRINPNFTDALVKLSHILSTIAAETTEAEALLKRAVQLKPTDVDILNNYAVCLNSLYKTDEAIGIYSKALEIDPNHSVALAGFARVQRMIGNTEMAEKLFIRSLSIHGDSTVFQSLGALYYNTGRIQQSLSTFRNALEADHNNIEALCLYVQVLASSSKSSDTEHTESLSLLREALKAHPNYCVHLQLAKMLSTMKEYVLSIDHSSQAIQLSNNPQELTDAYITRATALKDNGHLSEAVEDFQKAVEGSPEASSLWVNLGAAYHLMGDHENAQEKYTKALSLEPDNALAKSNLKKVQRILNNNNNNKT